LVAVEQHLRHLRDELSAAIHRSKRQEEREELTRLHDEVESRLAAVDEQEEEHSGLIDALEKAEIRFESEHPSLAGALREAIERLSAAGI
jgi:seryl-tRNA synthetase